MRLALIPPAKLFNQQLAQSNYHMVLPELLKHPEYHNWYFDMFYQRSRETPSHIMLDNGAFEGRTLLSSELLRIANKVGVDEVIVPDVMGHPDDTLFNLHNFYQLYKSSHLDRYGALQCMAVVHGKSSAACIQFMRQVVEDPQLKFVTSFGLPKILCWHLNNNTARISLARFAMSNWPNIKIHFLGALDHTYMASKELEAVSGLHNVRGVDTSLPYVATLQGRDLSKLRTGIYLPSNVSKRPRNYFELGIDDFDKELLENNLNVVKGWVNW